ncbi:hypothetical protein [Williamsia herbipolensis]|uniref:hypothetical protein n=1 Tax=Williamsia herbipolensis TaxID=1603258 RepID=UPI0012377C92|nr:hypothetical protein [Williamsia herbipolensis]
MTGEELRLDPAGAAKIVNACAVLGVAFDDMRLLARNLTSVRASGLYGSGSGVDGKLSQLGEVAVNALNMLLEAIESAEKAARGAGQALINQDDASQRSIARALDAPDGIDPMAKVQTPDGPLTSDSKPTIANQPTTPSKPATGPASGNFPMGLTPEPITNFSLDPAIAALGPAVPSALTTLAQQWLQLANALNAAFFDFDHQISILGTDVFSGEAASKMKGSLDLFSSRGKQIATEAQANSASINTWAESVGQSQSQVHMLEQNRATALAAATPENGLNVHALYDGLSQSQLSATWNPPIGSMNGSMVNLSDPTSPVVGTPLYLPGMGPKAASGDGSALGGSQFVGGGSSGGGSGGGGGGGGAAAAASRGGASQLQRAGSGTAPSAASAAEGAKPGSAPSSGAGNPASAASQMGKSAEGLTRGGLGSPSTRSSSAEALKSAAAAEKAAAEKAAMKAAKAGGGGGGGGAGAGGLGKAGAGESALSARGASAMSAAEKAMAAEQAATSKAGPAGTSAAPMGGRGAQAGGEGDGKHKTARYLRSTENGEEIVGELDDVAPTVLGGLNLDTSDDKPAPPRSSR